MDAALVEELALPTKDIAVATYVAAGGAKMTSSKPVAQLSWRTQSFTFQQDVKVLPLGCYDLITSDDWLEDHCPIWVHWHKRWMRLTHQGHRITLVGVHDKPQFQDL